MGLIAGGCIKLDAVYRIIDWKVIVLVAGTLPLATALANTGATAMIANGMVAVLGVLGPLGVLATLFLATALVGLICPEYAGNGTRRLHLSRLCQSRCTAASFNNGHHRR